MNRDTLESLLGLSSAELGFSGPLHDRAYRMREHTKNRVDEYMRGEGDPPTHGERLYVHWLEAYDEWNCCRGLAIDFVRCRVCGHPVTSTSGAHRGRHKQCHVGREWDDNVRAVSEQVMKFTRGVAFGRREAFDRIRPIVDIEIVGDVIDEMAAFGDLDKVGLHGWMIPKFVPGDIVEGAR